MTFLHLGHDYVMWGWWTWISSKWSGGGPKHKSYAIARFNAWTHRTRIRMWQQGVISYE